MGKNYSENELLLYLYDELPSRRIPVIEKLLTEDHGAHAQMRRFLDAFIELPVLELLPSRKSMESIMEYSHQACVAAMN